jgi:hypothetical protein
MTDPSDHFASEAITPFRVFRGWPGAARALMYQSERFAWWTDFIGESSG